MGKIVNDGTKSILPFRSRQIEHYEGPVYNLEVEEDNSYSLLNATVHNCFSGDSTGFFRRSLIERCVVGRADDDSPPAYPSAGGIVKFIPMLRGRPDRQYVYGVDPAIERDSFAVVILEVWEDHRRVVYCWTTTKAGHRERLREKQTKEQDFFRFCVRKLRDLFATFPPVRVMMDAGGGGHTVREAFRDPDKLLEGERPIYEIIDENKPKDSDDLEGEHFLEMVNFRNNAWVCDANNGLKKDLEERAILFPSSNVLDVGLASESDLVLGIPLDGLEDLVLEIGELKNELTTIVVTTTSTGLQHWDTPDVKTPGMKEGALKKDRYSALLLANMGARILCRADPTFVYESGFGGFASAIGKKSDEDKPLYVAPPWFKTIPGAYISRRG